MKTLILLFALSLTIVSCEQNQAEQNEGGTEALSEKTIIKRIKQNIDVKHAGLAKDVQYGNLEKVNDSTYRMAHSFFNPLIEKEIRTTDEYVFRADSIFSAKDVKIEMKSEGEWVEMKGFPFE